jgi:Flp pilus assembly protein TadG
MKLETERSRKRPGLARWSKGQSAVEFGMTISGVLMLGLAITNFAMAISAYNFVCYGARDATRYAAVRGATSPTPASSSDIRAFVVSEAAGIDPSHLTVATTWSPDNQPNSTVAVKVQYNFQFQIPFVPLSPVNLSSNSQLVISQ